MIKMVVIILLSINKNSNEFNNENKSNNSHNFNKHNKHKLPFTDHLKAYILNSLPTKSHTNQPRYTLSDCLELDKSLTESANPMLFSISKQSYPKLPGQLMLITWVISLIITPKDKTKSNPLPREKVRILSKSVVSF